jgi:hypothetical protein
MHHVCPSACLLAHFLLHCTALYCTGAAACSSTPSATPIAFGLAGNAMPAVAALPMMPMMFPSLYRPFKTCAPA